MKHRKPERDRDRNGMPRKNWRSSHGRRATRWKDRSVLLSSSGKSARDANDIDNRLDPVKLGRFRTPRNDHRK